MLGEQELPSRARKQAFLEIDDALNNKPAPSL